METKEDRAMKTRLKEIDDALQRLTAGPESQVMIMAFSVLNRLNFTGHLDVLPKNFGRHNNILGRHLGLKRFKTILCRTKKNIPVSSIYYITLIKSYESTVYIGQSPEAPYIVWSDSSVIMYYCL
jgi:hypothetical protein